MLWTERFEELDAVVEGIRNTSGSGYDPPDDSRRVPDFSRNDGGGMARVLFVLETPNMVAVNNRECGIENEDVSANTVKEAWRDAKLDRRSTASWNVVPWRYPKPPNDVLDETMKLLLPVIACMRHLRVVVLCGLSAQRATWMLYEQRPDLTVLHCPHPSFYGLKTPGYRERFFKTVKKARIEAEKTS